MRQSPIKELIVAQLIKKFPEIYGTKYSLPCSQESVSILRQFLIMEQIVSEMLDIQFITTQLISQEDNTFFLSDSGNLYYSF
jgi:hypothetical protein